MEIQLASLEKIGTIGSPSSTSELTLDILGTAVGKKLVGEFALFKFLQDNKNHYALGQITEIELKNVWLEDPTMRSLARQRGQVNPVSGQQDTHLGKMTVSAVFQQDNEKFEPSLLGTVPQTGTFINIATDDVLKELLKQYKNELFYLGNVYGSTPLLPLWFKHFDSGVSGAGEAYHIGIFGKTGSGKSVLAKMIMIGYAKNPEMGILVIDPQGEFAKEFKDQKVIGNFKLPLKAIVDSFQKPNFVISIKNLVLDRWELFQQILFESLFFERLSIPKGENRELACSILSEKLNKKSVALKDLHLKESFELAWNILKDESVQKVFYKSDSSRSRFSSMLNEADANQFFNDYWKPVTELFREDRTNARTVESALSWLLKPNMKSRPILIIDLSKEQAEGIFWNEKIQALVIKRILNGLMHTAEYFYKDNKNLNTLVLTDEAHRLAPRETPSDEAEKGVKNILVDAVRTTRKYGLGWMFISQTLSSLDKEIINQLRIAFFGFGLSMGSEFQALKELAGGDLNSLKLYQTFRDPHSAFDTASRQYSFMTIGPVSPLSFAGTPLFLTAFNRAESFLQVNNLLYK